MPEAKLPFLLVHGAWIWKVLVVAIAALVAALGIALKRHRDRRNPPPENPGERYRWIPTAIFAITAEIIALPFVVLAMEHIGAMALHRARVRDVVASLGAWDPVAIAAAMPGSRDDAIEELARELRGTYPHSPTTLATLLGYDALTGGCTAGALASYGYIDEAVVAAKRCETPEYAAAILAFDGRFDDAAAGADEAADEMDRMRKPHLALEDHCLAALLRSYAGDTRTFERLASHASSPTCAALEAFALPLAQQPTAFGALYLHGEPRVLEASDVETLANPSADPTIGMIDMLRPIEWLVDASPLWRADVERMRGNFAAARSDLSRATSRAESYRVEDVAAWTDLFEGTPLARPSRFAEHWRTLSSGAAIEADDTFLAPECRWSTGFNAAVIGDGAELARSLRQCHSTFDGDETEFLAVLPHVVSHRDELVAALRDVRDWQPFASYRDLPFGVANRAALHRATARVAGDAAEEQKWKAIFDRFGAVLADRRKVIAYLFWTN